MGNVKYADEAIDQRNLINVLEAKLKRYDAWGYSPDDWQYQLVEKQIEEAREKARIAWEKYVNG